MSRSQDGTVLRHGRARGGKDAALAVVLFAVLGCASGGNGPGARYEAAYDNHEKLSSKIAPKTDDPAIQPQSLADYHYTLAEANSLDGRSSDAIEEFRTVLVHDPDSIPVRVRLASEFVKINRYQQALEVLDEVKKMDPKNIEGRMLAGGIHGSLKNYNQAITEYQGILKDQPSHFEANLYLGAVYAEQKEFEKALSCFTKLTELDESPLYHLAWFYKGRVYLDQDTVAARAKATESFKKVLQIKPEFVEALFALVQIYQKNKQDDLALETLARFQKERGPSMRVAEALAQIYLEKENYPLAVEQLRILEKNPDEMLNAKVRIALIMIEMKNYPEAAEKLQDVLLYVPDSDKVHFYLAAVNEEMDKNEEAVSHFEKVPPSSPYFGEAMVHGAYLLRQLKKQDAALSLADRGLEARPDLPQLYAIKASLLDDKGLYKEAIQILKEGTEKFPEHVQLKFYLGTVYDHAGNKEGVVAMMNKVLEVDPNHVQGLNYLAYTYADLGSNLEMAETLAKRALSLEPKDGYIMDTYGWVLFKRGKTKEALQMLETAHRQQPQESIIAEHLGDTYLHLNMWEKARDMYEQASRNAEGPTRNRQIQEKIGALEKQEVPRDSRQPASAQ